MVTFWGRVLEAKLSLKFGICRLYQIHHKISAWVRPSPLSGNARILEAPIPVTYPLFTGRLVGWRKDEGMLDKIPGVYGPFWMNFRKTSKRPRTATKFFGSEITPTLFRSFQKIHPKWSIESSLSCLLCFIILILNTLTILKIFLSSTDITFR